jgi:RNA polymerase sigma factor (sigma-70 family)
MSMANAELTSYPGPQAQRKGPFAVEGPTDRELLERFFRDQDEAGFKALVRRHGPLVLRVCRRVLHQEQDAEDAFQATFLVLARRGGSLVNPELLGSWLYGVAYRIARKIRNQAARRRAQERQGTALTQAEVPPADLAWREMRSALDEELNRLPDKYRLPLVLCYLQGLTNAEAARRLGWPVGSMSYLLARGRELLRGRLRGRHRGAPAGFPAFLLALEPGGGPVSEGLIGSTAHAAVRLVRGQFAAGVPGSERLAALLREAPRGPSLGSHRLRHTLLLLVLASALTIGGTLLLWLPAGPVPARARESGRMEARPPGWLPHALTAVSSGKSVGPSRISSRRVCLRKGESPSEPLSSTDSAVASPSRGPAPSAGTCLKARRGGPRS